VRSFNLIKDELVYQRWRELNLPGLAARCYPHASLEALEIITDLTVWFIINDDNYEKFGLSKKPELLATTHARFLDILKGDQLANQDDSPARALGDIQMRLFQYGTPEQILRFTASMENYYKGVRWEAQNHSLGITPDVASYMKIRKLTFGLYPFLEVLKMGEQISIPPEVIEHPIVKRLELATSNITSWFNDIFSLKNDIWQGVTHNIVLALQHEHQLTLQKAIDRAAELHDAEMRIFIDLSAQLPEFGAAVDANLKRYISSLHFIIRGSMDWIQGSGRYGAIDLPEQGNRI
jgi:5-epi-alpha-selinene synthase